MADRDRVDLAVYGMEGVPGDVIEDRLQRKLKKKRQKLEAELKRIYGIDLEDPKFNLGDYEMPDPRPSKKGKPDARIPGHILEPLMPGSLPTANRGPNMMGSLPGPQGFMQPSGMFPQM